jgi:hypothetical protein
MKRARGLLLIGTFLAVAGCGEPSVPTARPTYVAAVEPSPSSTQDPFAAAIRHRAMLGLANDEQHVREVADDPAAVERGKGTYGFPLTAEEFALLERRARGMDDVGEVVRRYGAGQPDTWAGWSVDTPKGLVIAQFTADLPAHRQALASLLHPDAKLELRAARWTLADLGELRRAVRRDEAWFESIGADLIANGIDISGNQVRITIRTNRQDDVPPEILTHFNAAGRMAVLLGGGIWTGGSGDLVVVVRDPEGNPLPNLDCSIDPNHPDASWGEMLLATDEQGVCRFLNVPADLVTVTVRGVAGGPVQWIGSGRLAVVRNDTATIEITAARER